MIIKIKIGEVDYFRIASNIEEWVKYVSEKQFRFPEKKSLCLAGYCKPVKKANDYEFIKINSNGDSLKWSMDGESLEIMQINQQKLEMFMTFMVLI